MADNGGGPSHLIAGQRAEDSALVYLQDRGLCLLERNYRCRWGEIDLIMEDGSRLVFVEVRYRAGDRFGGALESVNSRKRARLVAAASHYLVAKRIDRPARFDVVALSPARERLEVKWVKDAFQANQT